MGHGAQHPAGTQAVSFPKALAKPMCFSDTTDVFLFSLRVQIPFVSLSPSHACL